MITVKQEKGNNTNRIRIRDIKEGTFFTGSINGVYNVVLYMRGIKDGESLIILWEFPVIDKVTSPIKNTVYCDFWVEGFKHQDIRLLYRESNGINIGDDAWRYL